MLNYNRKKCFLFKYHEEILLKYLINYNFSIQKFWSVELLLGIQTFKNAIIILQNETSLTGYDP